LALSLILIFLVNGVVAGMLPDWVATIPVELSIPVFVSLLLGLVALDWVEKSFLNKYI